MQLIILSKPNFFVNFVITYIPSVFSVTVFLLLFKMLMFLCVIRFKNHKDSCSVILLEDII